MAKRQETKQQTDEEIGLPSQLDEEDKQEVVEGYLVSRGVLFTYPQSSGLSINDMKEFLTNKY